MQKARTDYGPIAFLIKLGGLFVSLLRIGHLLTTLAAAKTLFTVRFTEDAFM